MRDHDLRPKIRRRLIGTYVALPTRFIYVAIILDASSRVIVGYQPLN